MNPLSIAIVAVVAGYTIVSLSTLASLSAVVPLSDGGGQSPSALLSALTNDLQVSRERLFQLEDELRHAHKWIKAVEDARAKGTPAPAPLSARREVVPVLVITCKRTEYLQRSLDSLIERRPRGGSVEFPIIVSRDCDHQPVADLLDTRYKDQVIHLKHVSVQPKAGSKEEQYGAIARHYGWALSQVFDKLGYSAAIIVEEDMEVSVDFFSYFAAMLKVLREDKTVWCVSSWNDNGLEDLVGDSEAVYRSDFFPGLGWMLTRETWNELSPKWPINYWDEFMRLPAVRNGRACIRPEVSRTLNFGERGVSEGQYYRTHLRHIAFNKQNVDWEAKDWSSLHKSKYDALFAQQVAAAAKMSTREYLDSGAETPPHKEIRISYRNEEHFVEIAKKLGLMDEWKEGIPRTSYKGVVTFRHKGALVHLCPEAVFRDPQTLAP
eukprot:m51a1_g137 putative alpha- -mannosyl-glycoprotein 2-beta-n-acetylglucosaminyltransferase-like (436) ;mRNA; r:448473-450063